MFTFDIASAEVEHIGISQTCETLKEEDITHSFESLLVCRYFELSELRQFIPRQEDDFLLRALEFGLIRVVSIVLIQSLFESPTQEPFEECQLFADSAITHLLDLTKISNIVVLPLFIEKLKVESLPKIRKVVLHGCKFLIGGMRPIILSPTITHKLIKDLVEIIPSMFFSF